MSYKDSQQRRRIIDAISWEIQAGCDLEHKAFDITISVLAALDRAGFRVQRKPKPRDQYEPAHKF